MNISANPWSFVPGDVNTTTITSMTLNGDSTVTAVVAATAGFVQGNPVTAAFNTSLAGIYNGFYVVKSVTNATTMVLDQDRLPTRIPVGTGAAGATGNIGFCQWPTETRIEDISWQSSGAPAAVSVIAASDVLVITDRAGNPIWFSVAPVAAGTSFSQNRGKIFWVNGVTIFAMTHGIVLMTVN
jgi:hypothetical protein